MADQHDPDTVGPSSPLFGFCSSDVVSAIPHGSKGVPSRASTTQHSTAQHGSSSDHVTDQQTVFGTNGEEQGASTRPPTATADPGRVQPAASPAYTAYAQPQRPDAPHRFSAHEYQQHTGYHQAQMSPQQFSGFDQMNLAGHPQQPPWYPPASVQRPPGTPAGQGEWNSIQQFPSYPPPYQHPPMGPAPVGPLAAPMGLHPSQTDAALSVLSQRALVGDPLAQRIMADHWQRQAAMSEGSGYRYLDRSPATYDQPPPPQRDFSRVVVAGISLDTVEQAQNSLYVFHNLCARTGTPLSGGTPQQDKALGQLVDLWCEKNIRIVTALRSNFPRGGSGVDKLRLVEQLFINPKVLQRDQKPEAAVAAFDFGQMLGGSGLDFHDKAQQLRELTSRLPAAVRGDDEYWIRRIREEAGMEIMFYYAEVLPKMAECDRDVTQASAASDWLIFLRVMAAAIDR